MLTRILERHIPKNISDNSGQFKLGSFLKRRDRKEAAEIVAAGEIIGVFNRGVNAIWLNGAEEVAMDRLYKVKGERRKGKPTALTLDLKYFVQFIDTSHLASEVREFIELSQDLRSHLGSLCFIRAPIKAEYIDVLPAGSLSKDKQGQVWAQSWDPYGHPPAEDLVKRIINLGVRYPAITSMNYSGSPEIVEQSEAGEFCKANNIPIFLKDDKANPLVKGSYTIITLTDKGIELTRDGNIPGRMIQPIFNSLILINDNVVPAKHPQLEFPKYLTEGLSAEGIRMAILLFLEGRNPLQINNKLRKNKKYRG